MLRLGYRRNSLFGNGNLRQAFKVRLCKHVPLYVMIADRPDGIVLADRVDPFRNYFECLDHPKAAAYSSQ